VFPLDTVVDAVIELEKEQRRWPAGVKLAKVTLSRRSGLSLALAVSEDAPVQERHYSAASIAAAVIHYCLRMHVPLPRNATKSARIVAEGFELGLDTKLFLQRQHAEPPADASFNTVLVEILADPAAEAAVTLEATANSEASASPDAAPAPAETAGAEATSEAATPADETPAAVA